MDIEDRLGVEITDAEAARCMRVGDLRAVLGSRVKGRGSNGVLGELRKFIPERAGVRRERITLEAGLRGELGID